MKRRRAILAGGIVVAMAAVTGPAWAYLSVSDTDNVNAVAGTLRAPATLATSPTTTVTGSQAVKLAWTLTTPAGAVEPTGFVVERMTAPAPVGVDFTPLATLTSAACSAGSCEFVDATAALNESYDYRVTSKAGQVWESDTSAVRLAASLRSTEARVGPTNYALNSVAVLDPDNAVAVGSGGAVRVCASECTTSGATWFAVRSPATVDLHAAVALGADNVWVAGNGGNVLHCTSACFSRNSVWSMSQVMGAPDLRGIFAADGRSYVVGAGGLWRLTPTGGGWEALISDSALTLLGVAGQSGQDIAVVGTANGTGYVAGCQTSATNKVCGDPGATFSAGSFDSTMSGALRSVAFTGSAYVAVGDGGAVVAAAKGGGSWSRTTLGTSVLTSIAVTSTVSVAVAGPANFLGTCTTSTPQAGKVNLSGCSSTTPVLTHPARALAARQVGGMMHYWAAGTDVAGTSTRISHLPGIGTSWDAHRVPPSVVDDNLETIGGGTVTVPVLDSGASVPDSCPATSLQASVAVPGRHTGATPIVTAQVVAAFPTGTTGRMWLLASANAGSTWSGVPLGPSSNAFAATDLVLPGVTFSTTSPATVGLCLIGASTARAMTVDLLHAQVFER